MSTNFFIELDISKTSFSTQKYLVYLFVFLCGLNIVDLKVSPREAKINSENLNQEFIFKVLFQLKSA